jgi:hypothetical protein
VKFNNVSGGNIANVFVANTTRLYLESNLGINVNSTIINVDYANNMVQLNHSTWLAFGNVATVTGTVNTKTINVQTITGTYDLVNNGNYSNTAYPLMDIIGHGDTILVGGNTYTVSSVNYTANSGIIYTTSNLTSNINSTLSVSRTLLANSNYVSNQIQFYGPVGLTYIPEIATESGNSLLTEDGSTILLG